MPIHIIFVIVDNHARTNARTRAPRARTRAHARTHARTQAYIPFVICHFVKKNWFRDRLTTILIKRSMFTNTMLMHLLVALAMTFIRRVLYNVRLLRMLASSDIVDWIDTMWKYDNRCVSVSVTVGRS